jgi:hypothetical protein
VNWVVLSLIQTTLVCLGGFQAGLETDIWCRVIRDMASRRMGDAGCCASCGGLREVASWGITRVGCRAVRLD